MGFEHGAGFLLKGLRMWRQRPGLMLLGMVPAVIVVVLLLSGFVALFIFADDLIDWATPFADSWSNLWRSVLRIGLFVVVMLGAVVLAMVTFTGLTLAIGDPFYEKIWKETEIMLGGDVPERGVGWLRAIRDSIPLMLFGLLTTIFVFVVGLVPVVGPIAGPVIGALIAGRLLAGELVSRALEARGMDRAARKDLLSGHRDTLLGFGVCVQLCFFVPGGAVLMMPAAVVGSTMLAREILDARAAGVEAPR